MYACNGFLPAKRVERQARPEGCTDTRDLLASIISGCEVCCPPWTELVQLAGTCSHGVSLNAQEGLGMRARAPGVRACMLAHAGHGEQLRSAATWEQALEAARARADGAAAAAAAAKKALAALELRIPKARLEADSQRARAADLAARLAQLRADAKVLRAEPARPCVVFTVPRGAQGCRRALQAEIRCRVHYQTGRWVRRRASGGAAMLECVIVLVVGRQGISNGRYALVPGDRG